MKNFLIATTITIFGFFVINPSINAQFDACDFFPCSQVNDGKNITDEGISTKVEDWIEFGVNAVFIIFVLLGAFIIVKSGLKYIRSQGDDSKIQEGAAAIKSVFIGVGIMVIGILGILVVLLITGGLDLLDQDTNNLPDGVENVPFLN